MDIHQNRLNVTVVGDLLFVDTMVQNLIKILDDNHETHTIVLPLPLATAQEIVRKSFGKRVKVDVIEEDDALYLQELTVIE